MMPATRLNNTPAALVLSVVKNYNDSSHLYLTGNTHTHTHKPRKLPTATPTASAGAVNHRLQQGQPTFSKPLRRADLNSNTTHHAKGLGFHHVITACPPLHSIRHHAGRCPQKEVPPTTQLTKPSPAHSHRRGTIYCNCPLPPTNGVTYIAAV